MFELDFGHLLRSELLVFAFISILLMLYFRCHTKPTKRILVPCSGFPLTKGHWEMIQSIFRSIRMNTNSMVYLACLRTNKSKTSMYSILDTNDYESCTTFYYQQTGQIKPLQLHVFMSKKSVQQLCSDLQINTIIRGIRNDYFQETLLWIYHVFRDRMYLNFIQTKFVYPKTKEESLKTISSTKLRSFLNFAHKIRNPSKFLSRLSAEYLVPVNVLKKFIVVKNNKNK